ncbi:MAG: Glycosyl transferase, family 4, conserved region [Candidatus Curtissbacteria bacterium GW2011_GWA1_40_9]|uniref:Glycosyl transferase, family 4, conserved region n=1 Tax=Candidatus Curtissbacteria bacterium GW2011_GWA1_40_9 TaxID=1618408 RepID=A0A0G0TMD7_9BACT|nr:MAG: Glycosyl transferase, family 4, conserved region [Candidatus Curtissbacteria bacterium GW2011_GWA1_40_9]
MNNFFVFFIAFITSLVFVNLTIKFAAQFGLVDDPRKRKHPAALHSFVIPRAGGLPIFLAFVLSSLLAMPTSKELVGIFLGGGILVFIGILDDKYDLKNSYKFLGQLLAALVVVAFGIGISFITNPMHIFSDFPSVIKLDAWRIIFELFGTHSIVVWADLFAIFWIVWVINMVNFSSGVDGQLGGIAIVVFMVIFVASLRFLGADPSQAVVTKLALIGAGATLGFLIFNFYPAKIFPGDSGSYFLGFLIAVISILSGAKVGTAILVMAIPLVDGVFTVIRRIAEGKSPFKGDRKHLHHRLLEVGLSQRSVSLFYWLLCAILGAIALLLPSGEKLFAGVFAAIIILGGILWLNMSLPVKGQK